MIDTNDYKKQITEHRLSLLIDEDDTILEEAELTALAFVRDALHPYYDVHTIYSNLDDYRSVKRWIMCLVIYYLYERVPDKIVPGRVIKNYDDAMDILQRISDGKISVDLPKIMVEVNGEEKPVTKFRWGSVPKKSHD